jgi:hypothetical protein
MNPSQLFHVYLRDHHAASKGGIALARRMADENKDNELGERMLRLAEGIASDRGKLEAVMVTVGVKPSRFKGAVVWFAEKLSRLKLNARLFSYSPLSRLLELEGLAGAIRMKQKLWESLELAQAWDSRLSEFDFRQLARVAEEQLREVQDMHQQAVEAAFTPAEVPAQTA